MKALKTLLLLFIFSFSMNAFASYPEKNLNECNATSGNQTQLIKDLSDCVKQELDGDSEYAETLRKPFTLVDSGETVEFILYLFSTFVFVFTILTVVKIFKSQSSSNINEIKQNQSDFIFKASIVALIFSMITVPSLLDFTIKEGLNRVYANPISFFNALNIQKSESTSVKSSAVSLSDQEIKQKTIALSKSVVLSEICAVSYQQNAISPFVSEPFEVASNNNLVKCINDFKEENKDKSISVLGNRTLMSSAILQCSSQFDSLAKDCGKIYANSSITSLNEIVDKYSNEISNLTLSFAKYRCNTDYNSFNLNEYDKKNHIWSFSHFCTELGDNELTTMQTDETYQDIENRFFEINKNFTAEIRTALILGIKPEKSALENIKLLNIFQNIKAFLSIDNYNVLYQKEVDKELNNLYSRDGTSINFDNSSITQQQEEVLTDINNADDYFNFVLKDFDVLFNNKSLVQSSFLYDFDFITDLKLFFGIYTDGTYTDGFYTDGTYTDGIYTDETGTKYFKVSFYPLQILQDNYSALVGFGSAMKLFGSYKTTQLKQQKKPTGFYPLIDTFGTVLILVAHFPILFGMFIVIFTIGGILFKLIEGVCMFVIELGAIMFVKKEPHILFNRFVQTFVSMAVFAISPVFALISTSVLIAITLTIIAFIPAISSNLIVNLIFAIALTCFSIIYTIKQTIWIYSYLMKSLSTDVEVFKGSVRGTLKSSKNIIN